MDIKKISNEIIVIEDMDLMNLMNNESVFECYGALGRIDQKSSKIQTL